MGDSPQRPPSDRSRVLLDDDEAIRYWTRRFDISTAELRQAVAAVGERADDVVRFFESRGERE